MIVMQVRAGFVQSWRVEVDDGGNIASLFPSYGTNDAVELEEEVLEVRRNAHI